MDFFAHWSRHTRTEHDPPLYSSPEIDALVKQWVKGMVRSLDWGVYCKAIQGSPVKLMVGVWTRSIWRVVWTSQAGPVKTFNDWTRSCHGPRWITLLVPLHES